MIYPGLRSTETYLASLARIREEGEPHDLVSVVGGFAFLHALSPATRSITLIDSDPEVLGHWELVRALLVEARSLADFLGLLSGFEASGDFSDPARLLIRPVDLGDRLRRALPGELLARYRASYGALVVDPARARGRLGDSTVEFMSGDLAVNTFCWRFGTGSLRDAESFAALQEILRTVPCRARQARFEELDYGRLDGLGTRPMVFLASNCESPLFTRGDRILHRVAATARTRVRYVSWLRDFTLPELDSSGEDPEEILAVAGSAPVWALELGGAQPASPRPLAPVAARTFGAISELRALTEYDRELLAIDGGSPRAVLPLIEAIAPTFRRIVWRPAPSLFRPRPTARLRASYRIATGRGPAPWAFTLRGLRRDR